MHPLSRQADRWARGQAGERSDAGRECCSAESEVACSLGPVSRRSPLLAAVHGLQAMVSSWLQRGAAQQQTGGRGER